MKEKMRFNNERESGLNAKDTMYFKAYNEYTSFLNDCKSLDHEKNKLVDLLKESKMLNSQKKLSSLAEKYGFSVVDNDIIQYRVGDIYSSIGLYPESADNVTVWYYKKGDGNYAIDPRAVENDLFHDNVFSPDEMFEGQWGKEMIKKYISFSEEMLGKLKAMNEELSAQSKKKGLKGLIDKYLN